MVEGFFLSVEVGEEKMRKLRSEMDSGRTQKNERRAKIITELKRFALSAVFLTAAMGTCMAQRLMCGPLLPENERTKEYMSDKSRSTKALKVIIAEGRRKEIEAQIEKRRSDADVPNKNTENKEIEK